MTIPRRKWRLLLLPVLLLGLLFLLSGFVLAGGGLYPRHAQALDLRGKDLTPVEYRDLTEKLPDCRILWDVPFQGQAIPSDSSSLTLRELSPEDLALLPLFPQLRELDGRNCEDLAALAAFQREHPQIRVLYQVPLAGALYSQDTRELSLPDPDWEALETALPCLPQLQRLRLSGALPPAEDLLALRQAYPGVDIQWTFSLGGATLSSDQKELDLSDRNLTLSLGSATLSSDQEEPSGRKLTLAKAVELLSLLPELESADLRDCGLTDAEMRYLTGAFPDCFFLWNMTIGRKLYPTDAQELNLSHWQPGSPEKVEEVLSCFPNLRKVDLSHCGLPDETLDALNRKLEDIRIVWSVNIGGAWVRTDTKYFYPFKIEKNMTVTNDDLYPLRYCTDIEAIDIGHMTTVTNCDWAAFMPNLKYLVIVETAITDLTPLSNLKNLVFLEIFTTKITDYTPLLGCTALEDLNLGLTYGDPAPIAQMTWLKNVWWSGVAGTYGTPAANAEAILTEALPNTTLRFHMNTPNVKNGWRQLANYKAMRDCMDVFYLD